MNCWLESIGIAVGALGFFIFSVYCAFDGADNSFAYGNRFDKICWVYGWGVRFVFLASMLSVLVGLPAYGIHVWICGG